MTIWVLRDGRWYEKHLAPPLRRVFAKAPYVMGDISERVSPVDGSVIGTRGELAAHNKRNNVVDIGDQVLEPNVPQTTQRQYREAVGEAYQKVASGYAPKAEKAETVDGEAVETKIIGEV